MPIELAYVNNFKTLCRAIDNADVALLECTDAATGKKVVAICAVSHKNGDYAMVPIAKLFDGDPYKELIPPPVEDLLPA